MVPLHVQKGFKPTDSTVSVFVGNRGIQEGFGPRDTWEAKFRRCLDRHIAHPALRYCRSDRRAPVRRPRHQVERRSDRLVRARTPASRRATIGTISGFRRWFGRARSQASSHTRHGLRPRPDDIIEMYDASQINAVVVGGETQGAWKIFSAHYVTTVSVDAWR